MPIPVVHASFTAADSAGWQDLFEGYDELRAVTFSSGVQFMSRALDRFAYAEVIFGCGDLMPHEVSINMMPLLIGLNHNVTNRLSRNDLAGEWSERIRNGSLSFYVARDMKSHEKLFLLKSGSGKKRVITGSANFSASAFNGVQREIVIVFDDDGAYDYYAARFEAFRSENCADYVSYETIRATTADTADEDDISSLPVIQAAAKGPIVAVELQDENSAEEEEAAYIMDIKNLADDIKKDLPKPKRSRATKGKTLLQPDDLKALIPKIKNKRIQMKQRRMVMPQLHLDIEEGTLSFNGRPCSLEPDPGDVKRDALNYLAYMNGLDISYGDTERTKEMYFLFTSWLFASIFMPYLRLVAHECSYSPLLFPTYGIIYGDTNAGKSTLVDMLARMMAGVKIAKAQESFNKTNVEKLKYAAEGIPVFFDDPDMAGVMRAAGDTIKDDDFGLLECKVNYPPVVIASNTAPSVAPEIAKRAVMCRVNSRIDRTEGIRKAKQVGDAVKSVTDALYHEYIRRMLPVVRDMAERMSSGDEDWIPDLVLESSKTIRDILAEAADISDRPYIRPIPYADWASEQAIGRTALEKIMDAWKAEPELFTIRRKKNELIYTYPKSANIHELQHLANELPASFEARKMARNLILRLSEVESAAGQKFRKSVFSRFKQ